MAKQLYYSNNATEDYFKQSVSLLLKDVFNVMSACYGPYGSHLLIDHQMRPEATKDGKAILSSITTNSSISSAVLKTIINVANKQVSEVGDGSTTTILLLCQLYNFLNEIILKENVSPSIINKAIKHVVDSIIDKLNNSNYIEKIVIDKKVDWETLYNAVNISADGDVALSLKIIEMLKELNSDDPLIILELSQNDNHHYEMVKGVEENGTLIRPDIYFNGFSRQEYSNPYIITIDGRMDLSTQWYFELCRYCMQKEIDIIFIGTGMNPDTLNSVISMSESGNIFNRCPVFQLSLSSNNDNFLDLCASLGSKPISESMLKNVYDLNALLKIIEKNSGHCDKALITETVARFNNPKADDALVKQRLDIINEKIENLMSENIVSNDVMMDLNARRAFMNKNYAKFYVGGYSPQRKTINYELADDAIKQAISCMKHGVVTGCNLVIPKLIDVNYNEFKEIFTHIEMRVLDAIYNSYIMTYVTLIKNKDSDFRVTDALIDLPENGYVAENIRDNNAKVINSAETDRVILRNASDMAALLSTAKGFISMKNEFDVATKGYDSPNNGNEYCICSDNLQ